MPDYIPHADADFIDLQARFPDHVVATPAALGLSAGDAAALMAARTPWESSCAAHLPQQDQARSFTEVKTNARSTYQEVIGPVVAQVQANSAVSDGARLAAGLPVHDTSHGPVPLPTSRPQASIDTSQRLQHSIALVDQGPPPRRARPDCVMGCEIWNRVGETPVDPGDLSFVALDTRSPYVLHFSAADGAKLV